MKKTLIAALVGSSLLLAALPVSAATPAPTPAQVACVLTAVSVRESALNSGMSALTGAMMSAYSTRTAALQQAYSSTTVGSGTIKNAVQTAWSAFRASMKQARNTWQTTRNSSWSTFRTSVKACKASAAITDTNKSSSEASGQ